VIGLGAFFLCLLCLKGRSPKPRKRRRLAMKDIDE